MHFYHIKDSYISYLRQYDSKVASNKKEQRPYIGVVMQIDDIKYYAPLASPKPKHQCMKNGKDFRKISGGKYGAINFNNMIPVPDEVLLSVIIADIKDPQYRRLLQNQYQAIIADQTAIEKTARNLRELILTEDVKLSKWDRSIKAHCCDLTLLEQVYRSFSFD